jgi:hypothetical protein
VQGGGHGFERFRMDAHRRFLVRVDAGARRNQLSVFLCLF